MRRIRGLWPRPRLNAFKRQNRFLVQLDRRTNARMCSGRKSRLNLTEDSLKQSRIIAPESLLCGGYD